MPTSGVGPSSFPGAAFPSDALAEFERRLPDLEPDITSALRSLGGEAIKAYASIGLYHNTLSTLVPSILKEGLRPENTASTPDPSDIEFADALFKSKGFYHPDNARLFDMLIKGRRGEREPGIFFYGSKEDNPNPINEGYGRPERLLILTQEMGYVMLQTDGPYDAAERQKAKELFDKYSEIVNGGESGYIAVLRANPFSPEIFNRRLGNLPNIDILDPEIVIERLKYLNVQEFEGIHISGTVPPEDLKLLDVRLPIEYKIEATNLDPTKSRYFRTPPGLRRI